MKPFMNHRETKLWGVLLISTLLLTIVVMEPLNSDNAIYQSMALRLVQSGKIPYLGSWAHNFPGMVYLQALAILLFGPTDIGLRLFDVFVELLFVAFFYRFLLRWLAPHTAALAAVLYVLYYVTAGPSNYTELDIYCTMEVFLAFWILERQAASTASRFTLNATAGLIVGLAILMRPTSVFFLGIFGIYFLLNEDLRLSIHAIPLAICFIAFGLVPLSLTALYYSTIPNGLSSFYSSSILFNLDLYTHLPSMGSFWWELLRNGFMIIFAFLAVLPSQSLPSTFVIHKPSVRMMSLYLICLTSALLVILLMDKFIRYQYAPFFMFLIPLTAIGIERIINKIRMPVRRHYAMLVCCFLCTVITFNPKTPIAFALGLLQGVNPFRFTYEIRNNDPRWGAEQESRLLSFLHQHKNGNNRVAVCSFDPLLSLHVDSLVGPYTTFTPLALRLNGYGKGKPEFTDYQIEWQRTYMDTLCQSKPGFIVLARGMRFAYVKDVYDDCLHYLAGFDSLLSTSYRYDTTFGVFQVFRRTP